MIKTEDIQPTLEEQGRKQLFSKGIISYLF